MLREPFLVLMAEDNEHDIIATRRVWRKNRIANPLFIVNDGEECLDFLYQKGKYDGEDAPPHPGILLLDVNMPKMDGLSVLESIRNDGPLRRLPVVIMTASEAEEDRLKSYDLGANAYIIKPIGFDNLSETLKAINQFWELVVLPEPGSWYQTTPGLSSRSNGTQPAHTKELLSMHR